MASHEFVATKLYYSIGEVAEIFEVNSSLIRFWEKEFPILKPAKNKKGNRLFTKEDIENLRLIFHLVKEKGFTLQGARDWMKNNRKQPATEEKPMLETLQKIHAMLEELRDSL
ncbi:MAG: MerR family transcriptional regulator [Bacteroidetes bacterium]|nr:MerR family transcriptional regulator [Bacteroidota bacterium]